MYRLLYHLILSKLPSEGIHNLAFAALRWLMAIPGLKGLSKRACLPNAKQLQVKTMGLSFPSPLGLAAGFDKNAEGYAALGALGFGFIEVGTITGHPQSGNPKPRLFRLPKDRALINRMGFNNEGCERAASRLKKRKRDGSLIVGVNIGKTKLVPEAEAIADYVKSAEILGPLADYLVVNVSSPNTPGLRNLQAIEKLRPLLGAVREALDRSCSQRVPLLVKIAPDLNDEDVDAVAELATELSLDGIIATNTTISRDGLRTASRDVEDIGAGGLSGAPLKQRSLEVLRRLRTRVGNQMCLISVGGIESGQEARERLQAGATLVQGYTAFIYEGPLWPRRLNRVLRTKLANT